ncbi:MAG: isoprenylcysteine carboxylmethyltransferase family protein [Bacteroidota bacterium]
MTIVFFFVLLFLTQPALQASDVKGNYETDKYSVLFILLALLITLSGSLVDWAYFGIGKGLINRDLLKSIGLGFLILGSAYRIWSIIHLDKYFSATVQFDSEHQLIQTGPYKLIRHPSYLGAYLAILGSTLFLNSILFFVFGGTVMLAAYIYRIKVEEIGLTQIFPIEYKKYQSQSKKMIPFIY